MNTGARIFVICDQDGVLLCNVAFAHAPTAKAFFEGDAERHWKEVEGLSDVEAPTIEWLEIEPPTWAHSGGPAWAGYTDDLTNPVIVAAITVESRQLAT